ncbi:MAG: ABC transporter ATP-binding protein [Actinomycetota bacterium]
MSTPPLQIRGLVKRYDDVTAVGGVDLDLGPGELLALVGPSGCGKSTLLRSIAGLVGIDDGTIRLAGDLVDDGSNRLPPERRSAGLVFQEHALFPHLTVADNVAFGLRDHSAGEIRARVIEMLDLVDLGGYGGRYPHELSGGERQRVALARALAPSPSLMLFDEPFASLDHNLRIQLRQDVATALRATDTPAVFVTHDQQEALAIGDRIAVMRGGKVRQLDTPAEVFHRPVDDFVGAFMGAASFLPIAAGSTALGAVDTDDGSDRLLAMVRPDDVVFTSDADGEAEIVAAEYHGSGWLLVASLDGRVEVQVEASHLDAPDVGARGRLAMAPGHRQVVVRPSSAA